MQTSTHTAERILMRGVPWETYLSLVEIEDRHTRIAYDQGVMEIMSPMKVHERIGRLLGRMIETWTEVRGIDIVSVASTTFKQDEVSKGFEADESYYIHNADLVSHLEEVDLTLHPGPDLVVEVDITNSSMRKFGIYASLQVAEVWRWEGEGLQLYTRTEDSSELSGYKEITESLVLPAFPLADAVRLIGQRLQRGETPLIREFRSLAEAASE